MGGDVNGDDWVVVWNVLLAHLKVDPWSQQAPIVLLRGTQPAVRIGISDWEATLLPM